jgi:hypothetical protein
MSRAALLPMMALWALPFIGCQSDQATAVNEDNTKLKMEPYYVYDLAANPKKLVVDISEPTLYTSIAENIKSKNIPGDLVRFYATYDSATGKLNPQYIAQYPAFALPKTSGYLESRYALFGVTLGWSEWDYEYDGTMSGTTGQSRPTYAFTVDLAAGGLSQHIFFQTHHAQWGWLPKVSGGQESGCSLANVNCSIDNGTPVSVLKYIQAIKIWPDSDYVFTGVIRYQAHVAQNGWLPVVTAPAVAGTTGQSKTLQAIRVWYYSV